MTARRLLNERRLDDYRHEFAYDHPDARADFAEYAVEGLGGSIYCFWSISFRPPSSAVSAFKADRSQA